MKEELIRQIIDVEWPMFSSVENQGGKASCQSRPRTFEKYYGVFQPRTDCMCSAVTVLSICGLILTIVALALLVHPEKKAAES